MDLYLCMETLRKEKWQQLTLIGTFICRLLFSKSSIARLIQNDFRTTYLDLRLFSKGIVRKALDTYGPEFQNLQTLDGVKSIKLLVKSQKLRVFATNDGHLKVLLDQNVYFWIFLLRLRRLSKTFPLIQLHKLVSFVSLFLKMVVDISWRVVAICIA